MLSLIPLVKGEKRPIESGWQQFCERLPTEDECDAWEKSGHDSYGLALGPASNILAIDIDSDDAKVLNAVKPSPVRKRGRKGETRFFKFNPDIPSCKVAGCIDVLALGRQTVLPPTIHPDTGVPYFWITPETLEDIDAKDLPEFSATDLDELRQALEPEKYEAGDTTGVSLAGPFRNDDPKRGCPHGSHDRLKLICTAIIARGASPDEAIRELLRYDEENHLPIGYFKDNTRPDCFADPVSNALHFYASNLKTFNARKFRSGETPSVPLVSGSEILDISMLNKEIVPKAFEQLAWPEPEGLLADIRDLIFSLSIRNQPAIALGGAIALGSVAIANRLRMGDVWPNLYVLNVAPTGAGKSFPYTTIKRILNAENGLDLVGAGGYRSSSAILKDLQGRRERLDLIDECSSIFKMIRDGGVFQQDMLDILNALWSESHSIFLGPESVGKERVSVWNPSISILFSTTPDGLKNSISRDFVTQGFLPRCLIFHDSEYGEIKPGQWNEELASHVVNGLMGLQRFGGLKEGQKRNLVSPKPVPDEIAVSPGAVKIFDDYTHECAVRLAEHGREEIERHFLTRASQQARKLAMIHGALRFGQVEEKDANWAIKVLEVIWHNASQLLPQVGAENAQEGNVMRVYQIIKKRGRISQSDLMRATYFLKTPERNDILSTLEFSGKIVAESVATKTKPQKCWRLA